MCLPGNVVSPAPSIPSTPPLHHLKLAAYSILLAAISYSLVWSSFLCSWMPLKPDKWFVYLSSQQSIQTNEFGKMCNNKKRATHHSCFLSCQRRQYCCDLFHSLLLFFSSLFLFNRENIEYIHINLSFRSNSK